MDERGPDCAESADEWWERNVPYWRRNPKYATHLERLAERDGREWVRRNKRMIDSYWDNTVQYLIIQAFVDRYGDRWMDYF
jgi:hypothetical protein